MSSLGTLEEIVAKIIKLGVLLLACNQTPPYGQYGHETQEVLK